MRVSRIRVDGLGQEDLFEITALPVDQVSEPSFKPGAGEHPKHKNVCFETVMRPDSIAFDQSPVLRDGSRPALALGRRHFRFCASIDFQYERPKPAAIVQGKELVGDQF